MQQGKRILLLLILMMALAACGAPTAQTPPLPPTQVVNTPAAPSAPTVAPTRPPASPVPPTSVPTAAPTAAPPQPPTVAPTPTAPAQPPTALPLATATAPSRGPSPAQPTPAAPALPSPAVPAGSLDALVAAARAQLSQQLGAAADMITVVSADAVEWPNTALGCPEPGMLYAQVITPGYKVVLAWGDRRYNFHADRSGNMKLCNQPQSAAPERGAGSGGGFLSQEIEQAKADLLKRVSTLKADTIRVASAEEVTWRDGSLGCPQPGMMYTMALVPGYRVVLESGGVNYSYHGAKGRPPRFCASPSAPGPIDNPTK